MSTRRLLICLAKLNCLALNILTLWPSYDGDEPAATIAPPAPQEHVTQPATAAPAPTIDPPVHDSLKEENGLQEHHSQPHQEQHTYAGGQAGNGAQAWNDGMGDDYGEIAIEPETHGTGIKEDG